MLGPADAKGDDARNDTSIVPGLADPVPAPREALPTGPMDLSQDPDRFENAHLDPVEQPVVVGPLDLSQDPDRMPKPGSGQSLTDLIGKERSYEEDRDGYEWIVGLLAVLAFLALVAFFFNSVLSP